jgi:hypothetical protein
LAGIPFLEHGLNTRFNFVSWKRQLAAITVRDVQVRDWGGCLFT